MRFVITLVVAVLSVILADMFLPQIFWVKIPILLIGAFLFVNNALQKIPADPPCKGVLMIFGKRQKGTLNEGWNFFPFYPFVFSFLLVKISKKVQNLEPQEVRTPDNALISMKIAAAWVPGIKGESDSMINYLDSGGESGVKSILHNTSEDRAKTWASSNQEGPASWREAQTMKDDVLEVLVKAVLGETLERVDEEIPTTALLRYFAVPQQEPSDFDVASSWAEKSEVVLPNGKKKIVFNWNGLLTILSQRSQEEQDALKARVKIRREQISDLRQGKASLPVRSLGITMIQFVVTEVKLAGDAAAAADDAETERRKNDAAMVKIQNVSDRIRQLMADHPSMTLEQAIGIVQSSEGNASKQIFAVEGLADVADKLAATITGRTNPPSPPVNPPVNPPAPPAGP